MQQVRLIGAACLWMVTACAVRSQSLDEQIQSKLDAIRKEGYPVTMAELEQWYPQVKPENNAADLYKAAFSSFPPRDEKLRERIPVDGWVKLPPRTERLPPEMMQACFTYLTAHRQTLTLLRQAATKSECRYPWVMVNGIPTPFPPVRACARLLSLETIVLAEQGLTSTAVESVQTSAAVSRSLANEPGVIPSLVHNACVWIMISSVERLLNRTQVSEEELKRLANVVAVADDREAVIRILVSDRCEIISKPREYAKGMWVAISAHDKTSSPMPEYSNEHYIIFLTFIEECIAASKLPLPKSLQEILKAEAKLKKSLPAVNVWRKAAEMTIAWALRDARASATARAAQAGIAVERYRLANGKLPEKLDELVPRFLTAVPTDPFDGQPIRYRKLARGFVTYSISDEDDPSMVGKDDGGAEKGGVCLPGTDIAFTVER